jgi:hypothetical protein
VFLETEYARTMTWLKDRQNQKPIETGCKAVNLQIDGNWFLEQGGLLDFVLTTLGSTYGVPIGKPSGDRGVKE